MRGQDWKPYLRWKACTNKTKFNHLGHVRRRAHELGMDWYKCKFCDGYHLTSPKA